MSALSERDYLAEEICELFTKLTGDAYAEDMARARKLAEGGNPHDHWLHTTRLDYESRLFMYMAAAFAMRSALRSAPPVSSADQQKTATTVPLSHAKLNFKH